MNGGGLECSACVQGSIVIRRPMHVWLTIVALWLATGPLVIAAIAARTAVSALRSRRSNAAVREGKIHDESEEHRRN
jgi:hypothetical protein